jgi:predicted dehydrogenase
VVGVAAPATWAHPGQGHRDDASLREEVSVEEMLRGVAPMRIAVAGCGYWGSKHARILQSLPEVDRVVLIDPDESRCWGLSKMFSLPYFAALEEALDLVDAVVVATPPTTHLEIASEAIKAHKHVLVEKPLTTSVEGARRLIAEAEAADVVLMVGHTFEYNAAVRALRDLVRGDELGKLHYIDTARLNLGLYQSDVNVIWDLAPHDVSIINFLIGISPTTIQAWGSNHGHASLEDVAYIRLEYQDIRVAAHVHVSWLDPCKVRRVTVVGSHKMAVYNDLLDEQRVRIYDKGVVALDQLDDQRDLVGIPMSYRYGDITSPFIDFHEPLMIQDAHFLECCITRKQPLTDGESGLAVVRILEACNFALRDGAPRKMTHDAEKSPSRVTRMTHV